MIKKLIRKILGIKKYKTPYACTQCHHINTNICNGCQAPYE